MTQLIALTCPRRQPIVTAASGESEIHRLRMNGKPVICTKSSDSGAAPATVIECIRSLEARQRLQATARPAFDERHLAGRRYGQDLERLLVSPETGLKQDASGAEGDRSGIDKPEILSFHWRFANGNPACGWSRRKGKR